MTQPESPSPRLAHAPHGAHDPAARDPAAHAPAAPTPGAHAPGDPAPGDPPRAPEPARAHAQLGGPDAHDRAFRLRTFGPAALTDTELVTAALNIPPAAAGPLVAAGALSGPARRAVLGQSADGRRLLAAMEWSRRAGFGHLDAPPHVVHPSDVAHLEQQAGHTAQTVVVLATDASGKLVRRVPLTAPFASLADDPAAVFLAVLSAGCTAGMVVVRRALLPRPPIAWLRALVALADGATMLGVHLHDVVFVSARGASSARRHGLFGI